MATLKKKSRWLRAGVEENQHFTAYSFVPFGSVVYAQTYIPIAYSKNEIIENRLLRFYKRTKEHTHITLSHDICCIFFIYVLINDLFLNMCL